MSVPLSCCLWRFPISDKDPDLMEVLGYTSTESLRWDYSDSEQYYILAIPPARTVKTLYAITPVYAWQWFRINGGNNLRVVYYPFSQVHFKNVTDPCDCPPEPPAPPDPPVVTSVTLSHGLGGDSVTIGGLHFTGTHFVVFGPISASSFVFVSDVALTATVPSNSAGTVVEVVVTTHVGTSGDNPPFDQFTYDTPPPPQVTSVTPDHGVATNSVTVGGLYFTGATNVVFGVVSASFVFVNSTTITATVPTGTGIVDLRVTTPVATSPINVPYDQFTYDSVTTYVTWDPASTIFAALSMGNLDASVGLEMPQGASATVSKTTGKWYFEVTLTNESNYSNGDYGFGIRPPSVSLYDFANNNSDDISIIYQTGSISNGGGLGTIKQTDVIGVAVDLDNASIWYRVVAGPDVSIVWNSIVAADPATNIDGFPLPVAPGPGQRGVTGAVASAKTTGKLYFEVKNTFITSSAYNFVYGICKTTATYSALSADGTGGVVVYVLDADVWSDGVNQGLAAPGGQGVRNEGDVLGIAVDLDNRKIWFKIVSGPDVTALWNNSAPANPATNVGGYSVPTGSIIPLLIEDPFSQNPPAGDIHTANFGATAFVGTVPVGFSAWGAAVTWDATTITGGLVLSGGNLVITDPLVPSGIAQLPTSVFNSLRSLDQQTINFGGSAFSGSLPAGFSAWGAGVTYNPATATTVTLSGGNLTVKNIAPSRYPGVQSVTSHSSGKWYCELTLSRIRTTNIINFGIGVSVAGGSFDQFQNVGEDGVLYTGVQGCQIYQNGVASGNLTTAGSGGNGNVYAMAIDLDNNKFWIKVVSGPDVNVPIGWNGVSGNPATNVGGVIIPADGAKAIYAIFTNNEQELAITANFGPFFTGTVPVGFSDWDDNDTWNTSSNWLTTLSSDELTATNVGYDGSGTQVSRTYGRTAGKYYYELTRAFDDNTCSSIITFGLGCPNFIELNQSGIGGAIAYANGTLFADNISVAPRMPGSVGVYSRSNGDVIGVAADMDHGVVWFKVVGGDDLGVFDWNGVPIGDLTQDPSTLTGGVYIPPPLTYLRWPALTYDPTTAVSTTLSNGNHTAANQLAYWRGARSTTTHSSGKWYAEIRIVKSNNAIFSQGGIAFGPATNWADLAEVNGFVLFPRSGEILENGSVFGVGLTSWGNDTTTGDIVAIAIDVDNLKGWFRVVSGPHTNLNWNGSGAANPAANVGGATLTAGASALWAAVNFYSDTDTTEVFTANFGGSAFTGAAPAGFSAWGNTATWDPATNVNMALSGANLIATNTTSNPQNQGVKVATTIAQSEGKYYFESTLDLATLSNGGLLGGPGIALTTATYIDLFNFATNGASVNLTGGAIFSNGIQSDFFMGSQATGDTIGIAVDLYNRKIWFKIVAGPSSSGALWNGDADANPAINKNGVGIISGSMVPVVYFGANRYPGSNITTVNFNPLTIPIDTVGLTPLLAFSHAFPSLDSQIANFGQSAFVGPVPTGFTAGWPTTQATSPPSINVWDPTIAIGTTLSNGNLTATNVGGAGVTQGVKSKIRKRSTQYGGAGGKFYFEITLDHVGTTTNYCFGFCVPGTNLDVILGGYDVGACYCSATGMITENNGFGARTLGLLKSGDVVACVANLTDTDNQAWGGRYWFKVVAGPSSSGSFTYWNQTGGSLVNFLSPGYLSATNNGTTSTNQGIKATEPKTSGKYYFEMTVVVANSTTATAHVAMGVMQTTGSTFASPVGVEMFQNGNLFDNGGLFVNINSMVAGQVWGIAVDLDNRRAWLKLLSGSGSPSNWNANGAANPATNVGGAVVPPTLPMVPYLSFGGTGGVSGDKFTANFGQSAFVGTVPAGFTAGWTTPAYWNGHPDDTPDIKNTGLVLDANNFVPFVIFGNTDSANAVTANFGQSAFSGTVPTWFTAGWPE